MIWNQIFLITRKALEVLEHLCKFRELKKEIERRKKLGNAVGSTPNLTRGEGAAISRSVTDNRGTGRSVPSLPNSGDDQLLREVNFRNFSILFIASFSVF